MIQISCNISADVNNVPNLAAHESSYQNTRNFLHGCLIRLYHHTAVYVLRNCRVSEICGFRGYIDTNFSTGTILTPIAGALGVTRLLRR